MTSKSKRGKSKSRRKSSVAPIATNPSLFIPLKDFEEREKNHELGISLLDKSLKIFSDIQHEIDVQDLAKRNAEEWKKYFNANEIPEPDAPNHVREYIERLYHHLGDSPEVYNWQLAVDEKSLLSHDPSREDKTRKSLEQQREDFVEKYQQVLDKIFLIYKNLQLVIRTIFSKSVEKGYELLLLKDEICANMKDCIDRLTYEILKNIDGNMSSAGILTKMYKHSCNLVEFDIWALKNVPIRFEMLKPNHFDIQMVSSKVSIKVPIKKAWENYTIRSIHFLYDHLSEFGNSFELPIELPSMKALQEILTSNWKERLQLSEMRKQEMIDARTEYEKIVAEVEARTQEAAKLKKKLGNEKVKKKVKKRQTPKIPDVEPPVVGALDYVNVDEEFDRIQNDEYNKLLQNINPKFLGLLECEINLREYIIVGGVYEIRSFERCLQNKIGNAFVTTYHVPETLKYVDPVNVNDNYYEIKFKLPSVVWSWMEPVVCRWEETETPKMLELETLEPIPEYSKLDSFLSVEKLEPSRTSKITNMHDFVVKLIMPRIMSNHKFVLQTTEEPEDIVEEPKPLFDENHQNNKPRITTKTTKTTKRREKAVRLVKGFWTTNQLYNSEYNIEDHTYTVLTNSLGTFGFACKKYIHFPFKHWELRPHKEKKNCVVLALESMFMSLEIEVTCNGFTLNIISPKSSNPPLIKDVANVSGFKQRIQEIGFNIFSERDTSFYILTGWTEKNISMEVHVYKCLSLFCLTHKFTHSPWNSVANSHTIYCNSEESSGKDVSRTLRITLDESQFVVVNEDTSNREHGFIDFMKSKDHFQPDVYHLLITSLTQYSRGLRLQTPAKLSGNVSDLLQEIRFLSFS